MAEWSATFRLLFGIAFVMTQGARRVVPALGRAMLGALTIVGCARDTRTTLAHDITIDSSATAVSFTAPLVVAAGPRALCFEFERPGDSHFAHSITAILASGDSVRDTVRGRVDRIGESSVCLRDSTRTPRTYHALVVAAPRRAAVRYLEWRVPTGAP